MSALAISLNDAAVTAMTGSRLVYREPGFALLGDEGLVTGRAAMAEARRHPRSVINYYWRHLDVEPLRELKFRHLSAADLASRQLEQVWQEHGSDVGRVILVVPAYMERENLGVLLGIAAELDMPVAALVDTAVAATRRPYPGRALLHVELSLHAGLVSRIEQGDGAIQDRVEVVDSAGLVALRDAWIAVIAEAFVRQSRFDPLHTAESEQLLHDRLDTWLGRAAQRREIRMQMEFGGHTHEATLEALTLVDAVAGIYQDLAGHLRSLIRAAETPALQLVAGTALLPGLVEFLSARTGGAPFVLETAAAARGALARLARADGVSTQRLLRRLPWDQSPVPEPEELPARRGELPTHILHGHRAFAIDGEGLDIGGDIGDSRGIALDPSMPGISRRHCTLRRDNGQCIVEDLSRYGTFLNGNRIDRSAVLQAGDTLRVGTPGQEFSLIRVVAGDDA